MMAKMTTNMAVRGEPSDVIRACDGQDFLFQGQKHPKMENLQRKRQGFWRQSLLCSRPHGPPGLELEVLRPWSSSEITGKWPQQHPARYQNP
ncbi:hypothetical protein Y1Q_0021434 [Alligator mississippiensis]|uniref:Uncharacterized protein n=1 Tax=Alligator mississippiensis TaxID=8496 RepID=A0A151P9M6_ALLMI|nr:hypothetical protein Y1Q_0021434 [Alligator mississippiensis]